LTVGKKNSKNPLVRDVLDLVKKTIEGITKSSDRKVSQRPKCV